MTAAMYPFRFHPLFRAAAFPIGVRNDTAHVQVVDDELEAVFGPWRVCTPLANIVSTEVTGPYAWPKVIGPPHLSFSDRGVTFATNPDRGVCIKFARPVAGIDPWGVVRHPSLTVTVRDAPALAELLELARQEVRRTNSASEGPTVDDLLAAAHDELGSFSAAELRRRGRERGLAGVSRMSRAELITLLEPGQPRPERS
jgi:hypothetical protein